MAEQATTTAPAKTAAPARSRARTAPTTTSTKAKPATKAAAAKTAPTTEPIKVELEYITDTARYAKFGFPANMAGTVVGNVYAPLGTARVMVALIPETDAPAE